MVDEESRTLMGSLLGDKMLDADTWMVSAATVSDVIAGGVVGRAAGS